MKNNDDMSTRKERQQQERSERIDEIVETEKAKWEATLARRAAREAEAARQQTQVQFKDEGKLGHYHEIQSTQDFIRDFDGKTAYSERDGRRVPVAGMRDAPPKRS